MTEGEFYGLERARFDNAEARRFKRLDKNHDGKLSEAEFAAPGEKLFARLDKNKDGVLTPDELTRRHHGGHDRHGPHRGWDRKPG
jgi:Ca2+-binding EF-hand superfamily protein